MKKILITGGAGYLGSVMTPYLLSRGYHVHVLDKLLFRQNSLLDCCSHPHFEFTFGDCRNENTLKPLLGEVDAIIPLAAIVGAPACGLDPIGTVSTNQEAIASLLKLTTNSQQILAPITNSGYGVGIPGKFCTEESPLNPISSYGVTKVEAEKMLLNSGRAVSFRLATVFGASPRMRMDLLVNDFVYRALYDRSIVVFEPHFKRNFIHIQDVARAFEFGLENFEQMKGEPFNVGLSDANLSKAELCAKIKEVLPAFIPLEAPIGEDPDKRDYIVSNEKIEKLGWRPRYSLEDGIRELIKAYRIIKNNVYSNV
jgi:nucleoside-diphosphate-sugar epimerase